MANKAPLVLLASLLLLTTGCLSPSGYIFTRKVEPYGFPDEQRNHVGTKSCTVDITQIKEPFSRLKITE